MRLLDIVSRPSAPIPWSEGENIPWDEPGFSVRMLQEHLCQEHDAASRRFDKIDRHVHWIHHQLLSGRPTRILDLGCGPGLYTSRLARLGHECVGIDYSPASIAYAVDQATRDNLLCTYVHGDIRTTEYGSGFGLIMLIFGEFNTFRPADARHILQKANRALASAESRSHFGAESRSRSGAESRSRSGAESRSRFGDGLLLLEPHTFSAIQRIGQQPRSWYSAKWGLFSDQPHLCLEENVWDTASTTATVRYFVIDASTGHVTRYAQTFQAYTQAQYRSLLLECGFDTVEFFPSLTGDANQAQDDLCVVTGRWHCDAV